MLLSTPTTLCPCRSKYSTASEPIRPLLPVTRMVQGFIAPPLRRGFLPREAKIPRETSRTPLRSHALKQTFRRLSPPGLPGCFPADCLFKYGKRPMYKMLQHRAILPGQNLSMPIGRIDNPSRDPRHFDQALRQALRMADHAVIDFVLLTNADAAQRCGFRHSLSSSADTARGE